MISELFFGILLTLIDPTLPSTWIHNLAFAPTLCTIAITYTCLPLHLHHLHLRHLHLLHPRLHHLNLHHLLLYCSHRHNLHSNVYPDDLHRQQRREQSQFGAAGLTSQRRPDHSHALRISLGRVERSSVSLDKNARGSSGSQRQRCS